MTQRRYLQKDEIRNRLAKIEGQVSGIQRMLDEKRDARECLEQVSAIRAALDQLAARLLARHLYDVGIDSQVSFDEILALTRRIVH